jgi:hypothetical protein
MKLALPGNAGLSVRLPIATLALLACLPAAEAGAQQEDGRGAVAASHGWELRIEAKGDYRDSEEQRVAVNFPFGPGQLPPDEDRIFLETVDAGGHAELSTLALQLDKHFRGGALRLNVEIGQLHDRNPTSTGREVDLDEAWIRLGRETEPALLPPRGGAYFKLGKIPAFERQDDRHLESYGLVSTAFNRQEDVGLEVGVDLGRHLYFKGSYTQGNPVFLRDPNALAGDNGIPELREPNPDPRYKAGFVIPYDADVADLGFENPEVGAGLGLRFADLDGRRGVDLLAWARQRRLADTVEIHGSFYGGDLDLLLGPGNAFPFPVTDDDKVERGANLWLYLGGFSFFGQYVDQELAGLGRTGLEGEVAWRFDLPLAWAARGRQLFPFVAPAVRYSKLAPEFRAPTVTPSPSFAWDWEKVDAGVRLGIIAGLDLTVELASNEFVLGSGATRSYDETLATLRYRWTSRR